MHSRTTIRVRRAVATLTFTSTSLLAAIGWGLPHTASMRSIAFLVLQADPDDIVDYGEKCKTAMGGKEVPDWDCVRDGEVLKVTKGNPEVEITDADGDTECNRPALLGYGAAGNQCSPYSRIIKKVDGDVITQMFCRRYKVRPRANTKFDDINIIQTNTANGKTCWFNSNLERARAEDGLVASPVPRPFFAGMTDAQKDDARRFWYKPSDIAGVQCMSCHDSDLWIHTPYVDQATSDHQVTQAPYHKDIDNVGSFFAPVVPGPFDPDWRIRKRIQVQAYYFDHAVNAADALQFPLTDEERALIGLFGGKIASPHECTRCHTIGQDQTCNNFAKQAMWRSQNRSLSPPFNTWFRNHWMPTCNRDCLAPSPEIPGKVISNESYAAYYTRTIRALDACCADPDLERKVPGVNGDVPVKVCQSAKPVGVANLATPRFRVVVKGNAGNIGIVSMAPSLASVYDTYPGDGFGGSSWTCPLNGDFYATTDGMGRTQVTEFDCQGNIASVTCEESNEYVKQDGTVLSGVINRYEISATPCPGAAFTGFADVCTGTDQCIEETWLDTVLTANFDAALP